MQIKIHKDDIHMEDDHFVINVQDDEFRKQLQICFEQLAQYHKVTETEEMLNQHNSMIAVLGMKSHSHKLNQLKSICKKRICQLLGDPTDDIYILFAGHFYSKMYVDIAKYFGVDKWEDITVKEFDMAILRACQWCPSDRYVLQTIIELKKKRGKGLLNPKKCRALSLYLLSYEEDENPFRGH